MRSGLGALNEKDVSSSYGNKGLIMEYQVIVPNLERRAYGVRIVSFTFSVDGASCPADVVRRQGFLLQSTQVSLPDPCNQCTCHLEKWYCNVTVDSYM